MRNPIKQRKSGTVLLAMSTAVMLSSGAAAAETVTETFDTAVTAAANGWTGSGNTANGNNFGWNSASTVLGSGTGGVAGGIFARTTALSHFADTTIASLNRTSTMRLAGSFRLANTNYDGNFYLGYFNPGQGATNFVGIQISEPSGSASDPFRGIARVNGTGGVAAGIISLPQNTTLAFDLTWTGSADGSGTLSGTLAGQSVNVTAAAGVGGFSAFGLLSGGLSSNSAQKTAGCYFDSLTYHKPAPTAYTITYDANGATSGTAPANQNKNHGAALTLAYNTGSLSRSGYDFAGWCDSTDGNGTNYVTGASFLENRNLTLYARWMIPMMVVKQDTAPALQGPSASTPYFNVRFALPIPAENDHEVNGPLVGVDRAVKSHHHSPGFEVMPNGDVLSFAGHTPGSREYALGGARELHKVVARLRHGADEWEMPTETESDIGILMWREGSTVWGFSGWGRTDQLGYDLPYRFRVHKSIDSGASWQVVAYAPTFTSNDADAQPIVDAFRAPNGDMFVAVDSKDGAPSSQLYRSPDNGLTWHDQGGRTSGRHSTIAITDPSTGRLLSLGGKDSQFGATRYMPQNISTDWGATWAAPTQSPFPWLGANQRPSMIRLASGNLVMVGDSCYIHSPTNPPSGWAHGNGPYVALSTNNGMSWTIKALPVALKHETRAHKTLGYATVRQAPNGVIHVFATMTHPCLHYEFNEAWITSPSAGDITPQTTGGTVQSYSENYPGGGPRATWSARITPNGRYLLDGPETLYYPNGQKQREVTWASGRRTGVENYWGSDGILIYTWNHNPANNVSVWTHWWRNGQKRLESQWNTYPAARDLPSRNFRGMVAHGTARHWNENGQQTAVYTFLNGNRISQRGNRTESFATTTPSGWAGSGNTAGGFNFGFSSNTSFCENRNSNYGSKGEVGGSFARSTTYRHYADTSIGTKGRADTLHLSGKLQLEKTALANNYSGVVRIGYFNTSSPGSNFVGIEIREPSGIPLDPTVFRSGEPYTAYLAVRGGGGTVSSVPIELEMNFLGAAFDLIWKGNPDGSGTLSGTLTSLPVSINVAAGSGTFNAFGILAGGDSSNDSTLTTGPYYFDNLSYDKGTVTTYNVSYNANGATGGSAPADQVKSQDVGLPLATQGDLVRTGFAFAGWNTAANGTGTNYAPGALYTGNANLTLYAKWTATTTYTVTYNANGATSGTAPANQTKTQDQPLMLATNSGNLARTGFTFAGWNTAANGSGTNYATGASYTGNANLPLYAKWTEVPLDGPEATETFDTSATAAANGWTGSGNTSSSNSYGWANTDVVLGTGTGGAMGGIIARTIGFSHFADTTITPLSRTDTIRMAGSMRLANTSYDGQFYLGYFTPGQGINNFVGIRFNEPSASAGDPFRGFAQVYGTGGAESAVISLPQNTTLAFDLLWTGSPDGSGTLSGTLAGQSVNIPVAAGSGSFSAFGLLSGGMLNDRAGAVTAGSYFDSLTYNKFGSAPLPPATYTVSYDANGATSGSAPASQTKTMDEPLTLATNSGNLARAGFTFAGWNTAANGSGTDYATGGSYNGNADLALFAKWTAVSSGTLYWDNAGGAANDWGSEANWSTVEAGGTTPAAIPGATDVATFSASPIAGTAQTVNLNGTHTLLGLAVAPDVTANVILQGGGTNRTLTIGSSGISNAAPANITIGSGASGQQVAVTFSGGQSIAANGSGNIILPNNISGSGSPVIINNGSGTGYVNLGALQSTVSKVVQDSATSKLLLRANSNGFTGTVDILQGTVMIGTHADNLGSSSGQLNLGSSASGATAAAELEINDNGNVTYAAKPIVLGTSSGTLKIALRDENGGPYTHTLTGGVTGSNNLTIETRSGDGVTDNNDKLTFSTGALNHAGTITHTGTGAGDLTINSVIGANVTGVIQNSATSRMILTGTNTYTGDTTVSAGTLVVDGDAIPNTGKLVIDGGKVDPSGSTETVGTLFFGAVQQAAGTWGSTVSAATNKNDTYFTGTGVVDVTTGPVSGFASWQAANSTAGGLNDDHDNDGVQNGVEWFLTGNADSTGFTPLPGVTDTGGTLSVTWTKSADYPGTYGTDFRVETSETFANPWTPVADGVGAGFVEITGNDVKYTFPAGTNRFARLAVTGP